MTASIGRPAWPVLAFAAFAATAYLVGVLVVVPALATAPQAETLALALVTDLVVLVPVAYAVLLVRAHGWRGRTLVPAIALSVLGAWLVLPPAHRGALGAVPILLPVLEVGSVVAVVAALARAFRRDAEGDAYEKLLAATTRVLGEHAGSRAIAYEMAVFRYALGRAAAPAWGAGVFSYRRSSGYGAVLAGVGLAAVAELVGGHLLIRHLWGGTAALVHLLVSGYAILWLLGDWRSLGARPIRLADGVLHVRCGLRWSVDVPIDDVAAVYHVRRALPTDAPLLDASPLRRPQFLLDLSRSVVASGPYGLQREVTRVALGVDEPDRFLREIEAAMRG